MPDTFIEELIHNKEAVIVYTTNGYQIHGKITSDELDYILVREGEFVKMVYKHAISTISVRV